MLIFVSLQSISFSCFSVQKSLDLLSESLQDISRFFVLRNNVFGDFIEV